MRRNAVDAASVTVLARLPRARMSSADLRIWLSPRRDIGMKTSAGLGQRNGAVRAVKQHGSELAFERPDRVADRSLGHAQFLRRPGEAELPPGRFKDDEIARRGQQVAKVFHKLTLSKRHEFSSITLSGNDPRLVLRRGEHGHCRHHGSRGFKSAAAGAGRRT
jgi:hypothetical protein